MVVVLIVVVVVVVVVAAARGHGESAVETPAETQVTVIVVFSSRVSAAATSLAESHVTVLVELAFVGVVEVHEFWVFEVSYEFFHERGRKTTFFQLKAKNNDKH